MKPISHFWLGLCFFARFVPTKVVFNIIFDQLKQPTAGEKLFWFQKFLLKLQPKLAPPLPKNRNPGYIPDTLTGVEVTWDKPNNNNNNS